MESRELIWELVKDNFEQARSHEEYREKTVTLTLTIASIMVAALAIDGFASKTITLYSHAVSYQRIDGICLVLIGVFGALCSQKHYERNRMHIGMAQTFLRRLHESNPDCLPFDPNLEFQEYLKKREWKAAWAKPIELNWLWTGFPLIITVFGALLAFAS